SIRKILSSISRYANTKGGFFNPSFFISSALYLYCSQMLWQRIPNQCVAVVNQRKNLHIAKLPIAIHGIPMLLIHVITRHHRLRKLFPKLDGVFGVAFHIETK